MTRIILIGLSLLLVGCSPPLTPEEVANQAQHCRDLGLNPTELLNGWDLDISGVRCHIPSVAP